MKYLVRCCPAKNNILSLIDMTDAFAKLILVVKFKRKQFCVASDESGLLLLDLPDLSTTTEDQSSFM